MIKIGDLVHWGQRSNVVVHSAPVDPDKTSGSDQSTGNASQGQIDYLRSFRVMPAGALRKAAERQNQIGVTGQKPVTWRNGKIVAR